MRRAHEINRTIVADGSTMARSLANLAFGYRATGDHTMAAAISEEAVAMADGNGERLAVDIINTRCNLAIDYAQLGIRQKAAAVHAECIALTTERLGAEHPELVSKYNNLGALELARGRVSEAELALGAAVTIAESSFPETSLTRLAAEINYASALWQSANADRAEPYASRAAENIAASLGDSHPATSRMRSVLGRVKLAQGDAEAALQIIDAAAAQLSGAWRADAMLWLAEAKLATGDAGGAIAPARECVEFRRSATGALDWHIAEAELVLGIASGDDALVRAARERLSEALPANHVRSNNDQSMSWVYQPTYGLSISPSR